MSADPYRTNGAESVPPLRSRSPGVEPLTAGELAFWETAYCAAMVDPCPPQDASPSRRADTAVAKRRERFGVR